MCRSLPVAVACVLLASISSAEEKSSSHKLAKIENTPEQAYRTYCEAIVADDPKTAASMITKEFQDEVLYSCAKDVFFLEVETFSEWVDMAAYREAKALLPDNRDARRDVFCKSILDRDALFAYFVRRTAEDKKAADSLAKSRVEQVEVSGNRARAVRVGGYPKYFKLYNGKWVIDRPTADEAASDELLEQRKDAISSN